MCGDRPTLRKLHLPRLKSSGFPVCAGIDPSDEVCGPACIETGFPVCAGIDQRPLEAYTGQNKHRVSPCVRG